MASRAAPATRSGPVQDPEDFSLVLGGPLFQLLRRAHLTDDALSLQRRRIIVIALVAWLPLLLLSAIDGQLLGGVAVPFLLDVEVQVKFLVVVPLLIAAELVVHQRMRTLGKVFRERKLLSPGRRGAIRCRCCLGLSAAQLGGCRVAADSLCLRGGDHVCLASLHGARHVHLVRDGGRRRLQAHAGRDVVRLRQPAFFPVPAAAAGTFGCSSGRGCCGRCRVSTCSSSPPIRTGPAVSLSSPPWCMRSFHC